MPEHDSIQELNDRNESNSNVSQTQQVPLAFNQSLKSSQSQAQPQSLTQRGQNTMEEVQEEVAELDREGTTESRNRYLTQVYRKG